MAGLTVAGFEIDSYEAIKSRIESKLEVFNAGFDFSPDSPDGQLIGIMSYEIYLLWTQLNEVYNSYDPKSATGAALKNLGELTGISYENAGRAIAVLETQGVAGTVIPAGTVFADGNDNEFYSSFEAIVPANLTVVASVAGVLDVPISSIATIVTQGITGLTSVTQSTVGISGTAAQTEQQYRNTRTQTVLRNHTSVADSLQARLVEIGADQALVINNTSPTVTLADGTPPNTVHVTFGEVSGITSQEIGQTILDGLPLGCPTYGSTSVVIIDKQGTPQTINYSLAVEVPIEVTVDVTYLSDSIAGAEESILVSLTDHINSLVSGEDVIWSRLFGYITPYAKAQVNSLTIAKVGDVHGTSNIVLTDTEFASLSFDDLTFTTT